MAAAFLWRHSCYLCCSYIFPSPPSPASWLPCAEQLKSSLLTSPFLFTSHHFRRTLSVENGLFWFPQRVSVFRLILFRFYMFLFRWLCPFWSSLPLLSLSLAIVGEEVPSTCSREKERSRASTLSLFRITSFLLLLPPPRNTKVEVVRAGN